MNWIKSSHCGSGECVEIAWRTSSRSAGNGCCVEVVADDWRKSSRSGPYSDNCVEVADGCGDVHVRDSKDRDGGTLTFDSNAWMEFIRSIKSDKL